jgi:hypothetical protein
MNITFRRAAAAVLSTALTAGIAVSSAPTAGAISPTVTDLTGAAEPVDLANSLVGAGVTISNVSFVGTDQSAGSFTTGATTVGFDTGIVLSSGWTTDMAGPNDQDGTSRTIGTGGDPDLDALVASGTQDRTVLEFDVTPNDDTLFFNYVFTSEEYNEFVTTGFNDVFGFFVTRAGESTKANCAVTPTGEPVTINTINGGRPFGSPNAVNPTLYRNNDPNDPGPAAIDIEADGLTVVLQCEASVVPNQANHLKLAIADRGDTALDSWVAIQAGSITTVPNEICDNNLDDDGDGLVDEGCEGTPVDDTAPACELTGKSATGVEVTAEDDGSGIAQIEVTQSVNANVAVPPFTAGTTDPLVVTATKVNPSLKSQVALRVTDVAGNVTECDPVLLLLSKTEHGAVEVTVTDLPDAEHFVTLMNGDPGMRRVAVWVNGERFVERNLAPGEERSFDVAAAMEPGNDNVIAIKANGRKGATVAVMISD